MADNRVEYGFRWSTAYNGYPMPMPLEFTIADDESFDVSGGASKVKLGPGDPVRIQSDGHLDLAAGNETTAEGAFGIVIGVKPYWDGDFMQPSNTIPSDVSYDTNLARQTKVHVVPVTAGAWEVDVDDSSTATTQSAYQAFVGENADHILTGSTDNDRAYPKLDISTHATTSSLIWRILKISPTLNNEDFSGANVKLVVIPNVAQSPAFSATGT